MFFFVVALTRRSAAAAGVRCGRLWVYPKKKSPQQLSSESECLHFFRRRQDFNIKATWALFGPSVRIL